MDNVVVQYVEVDFNDIYDESTVLAYFEDFVVPPYPGQKLIAWDRSALIQIETTVVDVDEETGTARLEMPSELPGSRKYVDAGSWNIVITMPQCWFPGRHGAHGEIQPGWNPARTKST